MICKYETEWCSKHKHCCTCEHYKELEGRTFGGGYMNDEIFKLYKRIMKHDPKAIDEIENLEEAKEIIKMMIGNVYLHEEIYQMFKEH